MEKRHPAERESSSSRRRFRATKDQNHPNRFYDLKARNVTDSGGIIAIAGLPTVSEPTPTHLSHEHAPNLSGPCRLLVRIHLLVQGGGKGEEHKYGYRSFAVVTCTRSLVTNTTTRSTS